MSGYTAAQGWHRAAPGGYVTTAPLVWHVGRKDSGLIVTVPAGWFFDVSVPWCLRWAVSRHDTRYLKAAALHDYLLADDWSRVTAGAEFHEALRADQVGRGMRLVMWIAVSAWRWA